MFSFTRVGEVRMVLTIWQAMFGNGFRIGLMAIIMKHLDKMR